MNQNELIRPEILAPAGSLDILKAAIDFGADAVYVGGAQFGARAFAVNFSAEELMEAIAYTKLYGRRMYLTVNTLLKEKEIEEDLYSYLLPFYEAGLDAVIVQDMGVFHRIRQWFPDLAIHVSTQAGIVSAQGAQLMKQMGAVRVVPGRELSLKEIAQITQIPNLEVECFVHGALCYCYSGHCLLSSRIGGRSGNRGRCAQPCRLPYTVAPKQGRTVAHTYALSPKDMCAITILPELILAGIDSFKIEGRMKKREYVEAVTMLYKKYSAIAFAIVKEELDKRQWGRRTFASLSPSEQELFLTRIYERYQVSESDWLLLMQMYNRGGFTQGYFKQHNSKNMMAMNRPNHQGVLIGKVEAVGKGAIRFHTQETMYPKDSIQIRVKNDVVELTSPVRAEKGEMVTLNASQIRKIKPGQEIYRMKSAALIQQLEQNRIQQQIVLEAKIKLQIGKPVQLTIWNNNAKEQEITTVEGAVVEKAKNQPVQAERIQKAISQTGGTDICFAKVEVVMQEECFVLPKDLKQLRRTAIAAYKERVLQQTRRQAGKETKAVVSKAECTLQPVSKEAETRLQLFASVRNQEQLKAVLSTSKCAGVYVDVSLFSLHEMQKWEVEHKKNPAVVWYAKLPVMLRNAKTFLDKWEAVLAKFDGYVISTLDDLAFVRILVNKYRQKTYTLLLDASLYAYNQPAVDFYITLLKQCPSLKQIRFTAPAELSFREISQIYYPHLEIPVYGRQLLMTSASCMVKNYRECYHKHSQIAFTDRKEKKYIVLTNCNCCYNQIYEEEPLSLCSDWEKIRETGAESVRLDFTTEQRDTVVEMITAFYEAGIKNDTDIYVAGNTGRYYSSIE